MHDGLEHSLRYAWHEGHGSNPVAALPIECISQADRGFGLVADFWHNACFIAKPGMNGIMFNTLRMKLMIGFLASPGHSDWSGVVGDRHVLRAGWQYRCDPARELPQRAGRRTHEGSTRADGFGADVRLQRPGPAGARTVRQIQGRIRPPARRRGEQHHGSRRERSLWRN